MNIVVNNSKMNICFIFNNIEYTVIGDIGEVKDKHISLYRGDDYIATESGNLESIIGRSNYSDERFIKYMVNMFKLLPDKPAELIIDQKYKAIIKYAYDIKSSLKSTITDYFNIQSIVSIKYSLLTHTFTSIKFTSNNIVYTFKQNIVNDTILCTTAIGDSEIKVIDVENTIFYDCMREIYGKMIESIDSTQFSLDDFIKLFFDTDEILRNGTVTDDVVTCTGINIVPKKLNDMFMSEPTDLLILRPIYIIKDIYKNINDTVSNIVDNTYKLRKLSDEVKQLIK
jgi:hypothetical protein